MYNMKLIDLCMAWTFVSQVKCLSFSDAVAPPKVKTLNGTYAGAYLPAWDQDLFLGIPFAQPPIGELRFQLPRSIDKAFHGERDATDYGFSCMQYDQNYTLSEDCLTLNVIRPSGQSKRLLPVLYVQFESPIDNSPPRLTISSVWVHGGGLYWGSSADPRYNLSAIVGVSQDMGQPIIAVSFNYRLGIWGFLQNFDLLVEGSSNAGLFDQRLALHWIQENIASFGGDPDRVVIWGESAGAQSIAYQMFSYDGKDDGLYHGAILESGSITGVQVRE